MFEPPLARTTGALAIGALLVAGLVAAPATAPSSTAAEPGEHETFLVSRTAAGTSKQPFLTPDGQRVAFVSDATDLVAGDANGVADVFVSVAIQNNADPFSGAATLISRPDAAMPQEPANGPSSHPVMSADGRYVAFLSSATNLVPGAHAEQNWVNVYVRDLVLGTTTRINAPDGEPFGDARSVDMSDDGRYVVFVSEAANLTPGDTNETWDGFIADLDADGNGTRGDIGLARVVPARSIDYGVSELVISGNGENIAFATEVPLNPTDPAGQAPYLYRGARSDAGASAPMFASRAAEVSIDATGEAVAYISQTACNDGPQVVATTFTDGQAYSIALGNWRIVRDYGFVANPEISPDGGSVAWVTTQREYVWDPPALPLPDPVVRVEIPGWGSANVGVSCDGQASLGWKDVGVGNSPSVSASARTVALTRPSGGAPAAGSSVFAVDRHNHEGVWVSTTQGQLLTPGFMTIVDIAKIPLSTLRNYAATLANAPIHQLPIHQLPIHQLPIHQLPIHQLLIDDAPIHQLPIHQLPIHQLPIHQLPIHQLAVPGGWAELLTGTDFAGELEQNILLADVLAWAEEKGAPGSDATPEERAAAERILALTLDDVDLDQSGIDALTLASILLGEAPLAQIMIPGVEDSALERWEAVIRAQGLAPISDEPILDDTNILAELDAAGLDIGRSGIEEAVLHDLPIASTNLDTIPVDSLFLEGTPLGALDASAVDLDIRDAVFGPGATGPLSGLVPDPDSTVADLAPGLPSSVTFGTLLFSLLDAESYPWEQIDPASINPTAALSASPGRGCDGHIRCEYNVQYRFSFDPGPGESTTFTAPTAEVNLPTGTVRGRDLNAVGSGPQNTWRNEPYTGPVQTDGRMVRIPLPDMLGGTVLMLEIWHSDTTTPGNTNSTATLTSGAASATIKMRGDATKDEFDDPTNNWINGDWDDPARPREALTEGRLYYEWLSASYERAREDGTVEVGPVLDEDYFLVNPPQPGQRLIISTNATDGQIALSLFAKSDLVPPVTGSDAAPMPGTAVTEQSGAAGQPAEAGGDAAAPLIDHTLIDQAVVRGDGTAEVEAASTDAVAGEQMLLRVTSGNGVPTSSLYSLRARYVDEAPEQACPPYVPMIADPGALPEVVDAPTSDTNTLYVIDRQRMAEAYGAAAVGQIMDALRELDGVGHVGADDAGNPDDGDVDGAVVAIDTDQGVITARNALNANPCSMTARAALTVAINAAVNAAVRDSGSNPTSLVLVGGDDIIPLAPVAQHTSQFNEASHAGSLRKPTLANGDPCPPPATTGNVDQCATPLSAAAATNYILTDDPYGNADAYDSLGGVLYVPNAALGRLIETPDQIIATIDRFVAAEGVLTTETTLAEGYGAWSELPDVVTSKLSWRTSVLPALRADWTNDHLEEAILPVDDDDAPIEAGSPRVISVNTHADETRMLPGALAEAEGFIAEEQLFTAAGKASAPQLDGALIFMIGCHAGGNLPTAYYGDVTDWPDVFSAAGGFVGNTGYGLANNVTTALGERLLGLYADWIGRQTDAGPVSASAALTYAKQSYLGGLGLYSGYDEKVLMEAVYYGLPMYTFGGELRDAPLPKIPEYPDLVLNETDEGTLISASLDLRPTFATATMTDDRGRQVSYLVADGQDPAVIPGQPILPRVITQIPADEGGRVPRGALITDLMSLLDDEVVNPAIAAASIGVPVTGVDRANVAFPSTFATITRQATPTGPIDLLVTTPGRVESNGGSGRLEKFTQMGIDVIYGDPDSADTTAPVFRAVDLPTDGWNDFRVVADPTSPAGAANPSSIVRMLLLTEDAGASGTERHWTRTELQSSMTDFDGDNRQEQVWSANAPISGTARWILQAVDSAGNVAIETARGQFTPAGAASPTLGDPGGAAELFAGGRLLREVVVEDGTNADQLTGRLKVTGTEGRAEFSTAVPVVRAGGTTRAVIDQVFDTPGSYLATLQVCRGQACSKVTFTVTVDVDNAVPVATVSIGSDGEQVWATSTLTASAAATDPDGDATTLKYQWYRNGDAIAFATGPTLALSGLTAPTGPAVAGDVFAVLVTPNDGTNDGHQARAEVVVHDAPPAITVAATIGDTAVAYEPGTWSRDPVTLTFTCTGGTPPLDCPAAESVGDTAGLEREITRSVTDDDVTASVTIRVKVDTTSPTLSPTVSPSSTLVKGTSASFAANPADANGSGIATVDCGPADTAKTGSFALNTSQSGQFTIACSTTDKAGNTTGPVLTNYTVTSPAPAKCGGILDRTALAPVNADGSSVFLRGSGVPVSFRACDAKGKPIGTSGFVTKVTQVSVTALPASAKLNELPYLTLPKFTYVKLAQAWTGSIPTAKLDRGKKYTYRVQLADGTSFPVTFGVR